MRLEKEWKSISAILVPGDVEEEEESGVGAREGTKISRFAWPDNPVWVETK